MRNRQQFFIYDKCWVCDAILRTPMHACSQKFLGLPRIHKGCYTPEIFKRLEVSEIVLVLRDRVEERSSLAPYIYTSQPEDDEDEELEGHIFASPSGRPPRKCRTIFTTTDEESSEQNEH